MAVPVIIDTDHVATKRSRGNDISPESASRIRDCGLRATRDFGCELQKGVTG